MEHILRSDLKRRALHCDSMDSIAVLFDRKTKLLEVLGIIHETFPKLIRNGGAL
jgi:hypothetical protein